MSINTEPVLSVRDLTIEFEAPGGAVRAVDGVSYDLYPGDVLGVVGESGSGKSVGVMSMLGLLPSPPARIVGGSVIFEGQDLLKLNRRQLRKIRGKRIAMVFQDPMTALNPVFKIGAQLAEAIRIHNPSATRAEVRRRGIEILEMVGIPEPAARYDQYPHQFSGGMRQRAMIAMAIANRPAVLIADEPTTALDVTIQAQVLDVLKTAQEETGAAAILITHDLGLVAEMANRLLVMYAGRVVETGSIDRIFGRPCHPYTVGLLGSVPRLDADMNRLVPIEGQPPNMAEPPSGCRFHPRCSLMQGREICAAQVPPLLQIGPSHWTACHFAEEVDGLVDRVNREMGVTITSGDLA